MQRNVPSSALPTRRQVSMRVIVERGMASVFSLLSRTHISLPHCMTNAGHADSASVYPSTQLRSKGEGLYDEPAELRFAHRQHPLISEHHHCP